MFQAVVRMVAFRYLKPRRQEGFVSVIALFSLLGVMLGVATLIIVLGVMNGFHAELLQKILGLNGHLGVFAAGGNLSDFDRLAATTKGVPGVVAVYPEVEGQVLAASERRSVGVMVRGVRDADLVSAPLLAGNIQGIEGFKSGGVILGARLAQNLGLHAGDEVTILSPKGQATVFGTVPRIKTYRVAGTFDVGMYQYDNGVVFMPMAAAQLFFDTPDAATTLEVFVADPTRAATIRNDLQRALGPGVFIVDWQRSNSAILGAVEIERDVMFIILSLIVVVAAFNIISSMIMLVKDKARDIAILRTMGASRRMILGVFILSGASIGIAGTLAGLVLGLEFSTHIEAIRQFLQRLLGVDLFPAKVYFFTELPMLIRLPDVVAVLAMAFGLSFLATIYPSWRAARLDPVEALRYE